MDRRRKGMDRRVKRLDEMSDADIEEMLEASIPAEHRYSIERYPRVIMRVR